MRNFLKSRGLEYLTNSFLLNKIDDKVAPKVTKDKLVELGLADGDIISYELMFSDDEEKCQKLYHEKAEELKAKLRRTHSNKNDKKNTLLSV